MSLSISEFVVLCSIFKIPLNGGGGGGGGTVTSVGLTTSQTSLMTITNSPITSSGDIDIELNTQLNSIGTLTGSDGFVKFTTGTSLFSIDTISYLPLAGGTMTGNLILNVDPTLNLQAATKQYVDNLIGGLDFKNGVLLATTGSNLVGTYNNGTAGVGSTFTITATGAFTLDGVTPAANSRILIKDQTNTFENGIYVLTNTGGVGVSPILTRSSDYDTIAEVQTGDIVPVQSGTTNASTFWLQTQTVTTIGTSPIVFTQFGSAGFVNPMTTQYDLIVGGVGGVATRLPMGTTNQVLLVNSTGTAVGYGPVNLSGGASTTGILGVARGGTGVNSFATPYGVICAGTTTTGALQVVASVGTAGRPLVSNGAATLPTFQALSLTTGVTGNLPVANGGTGRSGFASNNALVVSGAPSATGQLDTITGGTSGLPLLAQGAGNTPVYGQLDLSNTGVTLNTLPSSRGGTGRANTTAYAVVAGGTTGTGGYQVITGTTTGLPLLYQGNSALPAYGEISLTAAVTGVLPAQNGGVNPWVDVTGTSQAMAVGTNYTANNSSLVTLTLPATVPYGSVSRVAYKGTGGWKIAQNSGQQIRFGNQTTTSGTGGSIASSVAGDCITIFCSTANTGFIVLDAVGNLVVT